MLICQWDFQKYSIDQVQYVNLERLVIQFHDELTQDPILTRGSEENQVKLLEPILSPKKELNYQVEIQDHIHAQVQFQEMDNLPKYQCGF